MADKVKIIGDRILSMDDLDKMNQAEIRNRKYKYCTIECDEGELLAKVEYSERPGIHGTWGPSEVKYEGQWISIDEFYDTKAGRSFGCKDYRITE